LTSIGASLWLRRCWPGSPDAHGNRYAVLTFAALTKRYPTPRSVMISSGSFPSSPSFVRSLLMWTLSRCRSVEVSTSSPQTFAFPLGLLKKESRDLSASRPGGKGGKPGERKQDCADLGSLGPTRHCPPCFQTIHCTVFPDSDSFKSENFLPIGPQDNRPSISVNQANPPQNKSMRFSALSKASPPSVLPDDPD